MKIITLCCCLSVYIIGVSFGSSGTRVYDLPANYSARVDSIFLNIRDAFEGSRINSKVEKYIFRLGNSFHKKTHKNTIMRLILFAKEDTVTSTLLIESEKNLRKVNFLADAKIYVQNTQNGINVHITTYDHWSTSPGVGLKRLGEELTYWFGLRESNLFGTGQTISLAFHKDLLRTNNHLEYKNPVFTKHKLQYAMQYDIFSDGHSFKMNFNKPLRAKSDRLGFLLQLHSAKSSKWYYFDANQFELMDQNIIPDGAVIGRMNPMIEFQDINTNKYYGELTQSFGIETKLNISYFTFYYERHQNGSPNIIEGFEEYLQQELTSISDIQDRLLGIKVTMYRKKYGTVHNLSNFKWTEDFDRIWLLSLQLGKNMKILGADNNYTFISPRMVFTNQVNEKHFFNGSIATSFFISSLGEKIRGQFDADLKYQVKPFSSASGFVGIQLKHLFGEHSSKQLLLGDSFDLYGYPNQYYAGQARVKIHAETRFIPDIDFMTLAPAVVFYYVGGNIFPAYRNVDLSQLHSSVGIGLRLGLTRSVNMIVNHINLSWPLDENLPGPVLSIQSKTSL